jgi:hypothetical protein
MNISLYQYLFNDNYYNQKKQLFCARFLLIFIVVGLGIDSVFFIQNYFDGRLIMDCFAIIHFMCFFVVSKAHLRKLMLVMVPLSYIGELLCCGLFGMYHYRTAAIPFYVPFGHAILYASGYVFAHGSWAVKNEKILRQIFIPFFIMLFLSVGIFLNDMLTLSFGILFFIILKRKRWQNLYFFIACCVIILELVGTFFQCWTWYPKVFGVISTVNPPMGAAFIYVGGDVILMKIVSIWLKKENDKISTLKFQKIKIKKS